MVARLAAMYTVHHYAASHPTSQQLLLAGKRVVDACNTLGWHYPTPSPSFRTCSVPIHTPARSRGRSYAYAHLPPPPPQRVRRTIKDWDSAVDEDDVFSLQDLQEFETRLVVICPPIPLPGSTHTDSRKRFFDQSLYRVIPQVSLRSRTRYGHLHAQPHICPAPDDPPSPSTTNEKGFTRYLANNKPIPVPPHTQATVDAVLEDPYARCAWIIPVRGSLPWADCTAASVLDPEHASDHTPDEGHSRQIIWTPDALRQFWEFLLQLREGGALGSVALSFHAASTVCQESAPGTAAVDVETRPLLATDYVKVYHSVRYALRLRHVLYAWRFEGVERVLKGARLVLVDSRGQVLCSM